MGQHYKAVFLNEDGKPVKSMSRMSWTSRKLMGHSWIGNSLMNEVERELLGSPKIIVWAGDYAKTEEGTDKNIYHLTEVNQFDDVLVPSDYGNTEPKSTGARYLVNHDRKEFVDKDKTPTDCDGWAIHPLSLLTCEGNGQTFGDFFPDENKVYDVSLVGLWARNTIEARNDIKYLPEGYTEITFDLVETRMPIKWSPDGTTIVL
jgi:hypothetical protein